MPHSKSGVKSSKRRKKHAMWQDQKLAQRIKEETKPVKTKQLAPGEIKALNARLAKGKV